MARFENANDRLSEKPPSVEASFEREPITAGEVHNVLTNLPDEARLQLLAEHLLGSLKVPKLFGLCKSVVSADKHLLSNPRICTQTIHIFFGQFIFTGSPVWRHAPWGICMYAFCFTSRY